VQRLEEFNVTVTLLLLGAERVHFLSQPGEFVVGRSEQRCAVRGHATLNVDRTKIIRKIL
jgi:hypothetical protein